MNIARLSFSPKLRLRKAIRSLTLILGAAALAACEPIASINPLQNLTPGAGKSGPVTVGLLIPRGSGSQGDELIATNLENAARLALRDLDGADITLKVYSTAGNPTQAASAAQQAVADGVSIILGPLRGEAANAASLAVASSGVKVLAFTNNTTIAGGNLFILGSTFQNTADRLVSFAVSQGRGNMVVVHSDDVPGQIGRNAIQSSLARRGGRLSGVVNHPLSQQGVVDAVPRVRSSVRNGGANAVFLTGTTSAALPLFVQLLPEQGVRQPEVQYVGLTRWDIPPQTLELPGVQGGWFAVPDPNRTAAFRSRYQAAYGGAPHPLAGLAFDGMAAVGALVARGGRDPFSVGSLTQGAGFQGATGVFRLRPDGSNQRGLAVATVRNKQVVVIDPAPNGFGGAGF
jgi:ABC-type branched-subunit amino acid transport system substrate-binding protein